MKLVFFRTPKPRRFHYNPRYFDEERDRLEQRKKELGIKTREGGEADLRTRMSKGWAHMRSHDQNRRKSIQMTFLIYLVIAAMLIYFIFFV